MNGAIPPLPNTSSWRGAQLQKSTGTALPLPYLYCCCYIHSKLTRAAEDRVKSTENRREDEC